MRVVLHYRASTGFRAALTRLAPAWMQVDVIDPAAVAQLDEALPDTEVLLHVLEPVTASMIARAPRLRLIQKIGIGLNTIDLDAARAAGIAVANMPGSNSQAVAEMALALMLACLRRTVTLNEAVRAGRGWRLPADTFDQVGEIADATVGLLGFGAVPRKLTPVLQALGARVIAWSRTPAVVSGVSFMSLAALLRESDIISLHLPATDATHHLLDAARFAEMKRGVIVINTARGSLLDEVALAAALASGHVRAAGLDVFAAEPVALDQPLCRFEQVVTSPHCAWLTPQTLARSLGIAIENCRRVQCGESLLHEVVPAAA